MKRFMHWSIRIFYALSWLLLFGYFWISCFGYWPLIQITSDVSKRLEAPDHSKTALPIRRKAFLDLNFIVKVISKSKAATLYTSPDYIPDPTVDYNERIEWSKDSSLIVFNTDSIPAKGTRYLNLRY